MLLGSCLHGLRNRIFPLKVSVEIEKSLGKHIQMGKI